MFKKNKDKKIEKNKDNKFKSKNTKNIEKSRTETGLLLDGNRDGEKSVLKPGTRNLLDMYAPSGISIGSDDHMVVGNKFVRSFVVQQYPNRVGIGWLDSIYNHSGNMDTSVFVSPADNRKAMDELTKKITQFQSQLEVERTKGSNKHVTEYLAKIDSLFVERSKIEQNIENLYHVSINSNLICGSKEELEKQSQMLDATTKGNRMQLMPTYLRMDEGYKSALPMAKIFLKDKLRNLNTGGLVSCFPFYNSEIMHPRGVFLGMNKLTGTPLYLDFYDDKMLKNNNISVFGQIGSGKSYFLKLLTMRSALKGVKTTIIDPEGEYSSITRALGGVNLKIAPNSEEAINPFDIEEEAELDVNMRPTGKIIVDIKSKVADLLNLISVMAGSDGTTMEERSLVSKVLLNLYQSFGIDEKASSLCYEGDFYDEVEDIFYQKGKRKKMPQFSDFHNELTKLSKTENGSSLKKLVNSLTMFKKGGVYDMFDCQSSVDVASFAQAPIINYDVSSLEESILRPIGMYIALSWAWEKFGKKNPMIRKRIVCDEAWMLVNPKMAGYQYTANFLETVARRIRKRNGGLLIASQSYVEFSGTPEGDAVLTNTAVQILLKQSVTSIDALQKKFKLSDGEKVYLQQATVGEMLIKTSDESTIAYSYSFPYEHNLIDNRASY